MIRPHIASNVIVDANLLREQMVPQALAKKINADRKQSAFLKMVGGDGIEPTASSVSRKRSPTELTARAFCPPEANRQSIAKGPVAVKRFCLDGSGPFIPRERKLLAQ